MNTEQDYARVSQRVERRTHRRAFYVSVVALCGAAYPVHYAVDRMSRCEEAPQDLLGLLMWSPENHLLPLLLGVAALAFFIYAFPRRDRADVSIERRSVRYDVDSDELHERVVLMEVIERGDERETTSRKVVDQVIVERLSAVVEWGSISHNRTVTQRRDPIDDPRDPAPTMDKVTLTETQSWVKYTDGSTATVNCHADLRDVEAKANELILAAAAASERP